MMPIHTHITTESEKKAGWRLLVLVLLAFLFVRITLKKYNSVEYDYLVFRACMFVVVVVFAVTAAAAAATAVAAAATTTTTTTIVHNTQRRKYLCCTARYDVFRRCCSSFPMRHGHFGLLSVLLTDASDTYCAITYGRAKFLLGAKFGFISGASVKHVCKIYTGRDSNDSPPIFERSFALRFT